MVPSHPWGPPAPKGTQRPPNSRGPQHPRVHPNALQLKGTPSSQRHPTPTQPMRSMAPKGAPRCPPTPRGSWHPKVHPKPPQTHTPAWCPSIPYGPPPPKPARRPPNPRGPQHPRVHPGAHPPQWGLSTQRCPPPIPTHPHTPPCRVLAERQRHVEEDQQVADGKHRQILRRGAAQLVLQGALQGGMELRGTPAPMGAPKTPP